MLENPFIGMFPPIAFLVAMAFATKLIREPYLSFLPWAAVAFFAFGVLLVIHINRRMQHSRVAYYDLDSDKRDIYFSPKVPIDQKFRGILERTAFFTGMASICYFLLSLVCIGLWLLGKFVVKP